MTMHEHVFIYILLGSSIFIGITNSHFLHDDGGQVKEIRRVSYQVELVKKPSTERRHGSPHDGLERYGERMHSFSEHGEFDSHRAGNDGISELVPIEGLQGHNVEFDEIVGMKSEEHNPLTHRSDRGHYSPNSGMEVFGGRIHSLNVHGEHGEYDRHGVRNDGIGEFVPIERLHGHNVEFGGIVGTKSGENNPLTHRSDRLHDSPNDGIEIFRGKSHSLNEHEENSEYDRHGVKNDGISELDPIVRLHRHNSKCGGIVGIKSIEHNPLTHRSDRLHESPTEGIEIIGGRIHSRNEHGEHGKIDRLGVRNYGISELHPIGKLHRHNVEFGEVVGKNDELKRSNSVKKELRVNNNINEGLSASDSKIVGMSSIGGSEEENLSRNNKAVRFDESNDGIGTLVKNGHLIGELQSVNGDIDGLLDRNNKAGRLRESIDGVNGQSGSIIGFRGSGESSGRISELGKTYNGLGKMKAIYNSAGEMIGVSQLGGNNGEIGEMSKSINIFDDLNGGYGSLGGIIGNYGSIDVLGRSNTAVSHLGRQYSAIGNYGRPYKNYGGNYRYVGGYGRFGEPYGIYGSNNGFGKSYGRFGGPNGNYGIGFQVGSNNGVSVSNRETDGVASSSTSNEETGSPSGNDAEIQFELTSNEERAPASEFDVETGDLGASGIEKEDLTGSALVSESEDIIGRQGGSDVEKVVVDLDKGETDELIENNGEIGDLNPSNTKTSELSAGIVETDELSASDAQVGSEIINNVGLMLVTGEPSGSVLIDEFEKQKGIPEAKAVTGASNVETSEPVESTIENGKFGANHVEKDKSSASQNMDNVEAAGQIENNNDMVSEIFTIVETGGPNRSALVGAGNDEIDLPSESNKETSAFDVNNSETRERSKVETGNQSFETGERSNVENDESSKIDVEIVPEIETRGKIRRSSKSKKGKVSDTANIMETGRPSGSFEDNIELPRLREIKYAAFPVVATKVEIVRSRRHIEKIESKLESNTKNTIPSGNIDKVAPETTPDVKIAPVVSSDVKNIKRSENIDRIAPEITYNGKIESEFESKVKNIIPSGNIDKKAPEIMSNGKKASEFKSNFKPFILGGNIYQIAPEIKPNAKIASEFESNVNILPRRIIDKITLLTFKYNKKC